MNQPSADRRLILQAVAVGVATGLLPSAQRVDAQPAAETEFLLSRGLAYLNTGTIGPCRRATVEATRAAWEAL